MSTALCIAILEQAVIQRVAFRLSERIWIPAFAGKAELVPYVFLVLRQAQHEEECEA